MRAKSSLLPGVGLAFASVGSAILVTQSLDPVLPTPMFFAAIVVSTRHGGVISGLLAVALSTASLDYYFIPPLHSFWLKPGLISYLIQFLVPALVTCWFVNKRKDTEISLRQARDELESRVRERTAELAKANDQLREQIAERTRAEEIVQKTQAELAHVTRVTTLGELAASIAHEVNQPLMAVVLNGDACLRWLGRSHPDLEQARKAVGTVIAEGHRAGEIIRRIRALFQKSAMQKAPVDINDLIAGILTLTRREMLRNRLSCTTEFAPSLPPVLGDRVQLQQVVLNLVMNGIEAMAGIADRPREMRIRTEMENGPDGGVLVSVRDSGRGLPAEQLDRIFSAFFTTKPDGLGMGLSISRTIVEAHGGKLWAASSNDGAIFHFRLPACGKAA